MDGGWIRCRCGRGEWDVGCFGKVYDCDRGGRISREEGVENVAGDVGGGGRVYPDESGWGQKLWEERVWERGGE